MVFILGIYCVFLIVSKFVYNCIIFGDGLNIFFFYKKRKVNIFKDLIIGKIFLKIYL